MYRCLSIFFALIASCLPAFGQSGKTTIQSGNVTPGHASCWTTNGIVQDCGTAAIPFLTSLGVVGQGQTICAWTALSTAPGSQQLCFGVFDNAAATITLQNFGIDTPQPLNFVINGTTYPFPYTVGGIVGPNSSTVGDFAEWNNTTGSLLKDVTPSTAFDQVCSTNGALFARLSSAWGCAPNLVEATGSFTVSQASFGLSGNISAPAWLTSGIRYVNVAATLTDTTSTGTVATVYNDVWGGNTNAASSATTYTNAYGSYFKAPIAGTNVTFTSSYALGADSAYIGGSFVVNQNAAVPTALTISASGAGAKLVGLDATNSGWSASTFGANGQNAFVRYDGTQASPTALLSDELIGRLTFSGANTTTTSLSNKAQVGCFAAENWGSTASGTYCDVFTDAKTTTTVQSNFRFQGSGGLSVGNANLATDGGAGVVVATKYNVGASQIACANLANAGTICPQNYTATTWTPTITTDATVGTPAYTTHTGTYEQIGRQVTVRFNITLSGWTGSPTGNVSIAGLPVADADNFGTCVISFYIVTGLAASNIGITGLIADTTSAIILYQNSNTASSKITAAQAGTTASLAGFCSYHA